jgi:hypothetical protein
MNRLFSLRHGIHHLAFDWFVIGFIVGFGMLAAIVAMFL